MKTPLHSVIAVILATAWITVSTTSAAEPAAADEKRIEQLKEDFLKLKFGMFLHYNMATYTGEQWVTGYPECFYFWNDAYDPELGTAEELLKFERGINPNVLASSNWWNWGKKGTPYLDIAVTELRMFPEDHQGPGETCYSLTGRNWFWNESVRAYPAAKGVVERLHAINSRNANYLLNVPPNKQGKLDDGAVKVLQEVGKLRANNE